MFLDASNCPVHRVLSEGVFQALKSPRKNAHIDIGYGKIPYLLCKARHMSVDYNQIITMEPGKRSGQPCIRGMRITVYDVLEYLAGGMSVEELLHDFPELTQEDIRACFAFAAAPKRREKALPTT